MEPLTANDCLPITEDVAWVRVAAGSAVGTARRTAGQLADRLGFPATRVAEIELAVTEIGTNLHKHARDGAVLIRSTRAATESAVEIVAMDAGPGMADPLRSRLDGESTAGTLGIGLGAVARLADVHRISSRPGGRTVLTARFHPRRGPLAEIADNDPTGLTRPINGEQECGDAYAIRRTPGRVSLMLCDGSGHGPLAASAARAAVRVFCGRPAAPPDQVVRLLHDELRGTRGGAVAVADLDLAGGRVVFAGLGNVSAAVVADGRKRQMVSLPGIAGYQSRTIRAFEYPLPPGAVVVLHSDGLSEKWTVGPDGVQMTDSPLLNAAMLLGVAGTRIDDAGVVVAMAPADRPA
jgi:anti-sigma regulatory factor (Ser/Thr protein kinase)